MNDQTKRSSIPYRCEGGCGADLSGEPIPVTSHDCYDPPFVFSKVIGGMYNDRVVAWICPHCQTAWSRSEPPSSGFRKFDLVTLRNNDVAKFL